MLAKKPAVLFDIGGPLDTEQRLAETVSTAIINGFRERGTRIDRTRYDAAVRYATDVYAPEDFPAIIWHLANGDLSLSASLWDEVSPLLNSARRAELFTPREGMAAILESLVRKGVKLGLAANQPASALAPLDATGFGQHFAWRGVSGTVGFRKPDHRLFLAACEGLGVSPDGCIMVGDRIDVDIAPARQLGMTTILFRTGPHQRQTARSWLEAPHHEVSSAEELARLFEAW